MEELQKFNLIYLATPYSKFKHGLNAAFEEANRLANRLIIRGVSVFAPIVYTHSLSVFGGCLDPLDAELWKRVDKPYTKVCDAMIIGMLEGWDESEGVAGETVIFNAASKPVFLIDPDSLALLTWGDATGGPYVVR